MCVPGYNYTYNELGLGHGYIHNILALNTRVYMSCSNVYYMCAYVCV